jgi:CheY-like chemotaxis protein
MEYKTIIIVDDNPTTIFYNADVLSDAFPQATILSFEDPSQFLETYKTRLNQEGQISLLLLDISMPSLLGFDVLCEIDEEYEAVGHLDVIMVTSSHLKADVEKAQRFGNVKGYIEKPLTEAKLNLILKKSSE